MTEKYRNLLSRYLVIERVIEDLKTKSESELILQYKGELKSIDDNWSNFSGDCAGHAHMCLGLKIDCIENGYHLDQA